MMNMRIPARLVLVAMLALPATGAFASERHDATTAAQEQAIRDTLTAQGYDVRKIKREDGLFEAYAIKDGERLEIYLDSAMNIVRTKRDD